MESAPARSKPSSQDTLVSLLEEHAVPLDTIHQRYWSLMQLIRTLIGVIPNYDSYLEIWPPAFRTCHLLVPNFLNLPFSIFGFGSAPKNILGLAMYVASRTAQCSYCSAHCCSFAIRRGTDPAKIAAALTASSSFSPQELATIEVARSVAELPGSLTPSTREQFDKCFSPAHREWIVLSISMMGFLNKFMDAIGVQLEPSTLAEAKHTMEATWSAGKAGGSLHPNAEAQAPPNADSLLTMLSTLCFIPRAMQLDEQWQHGVPNAWPRVGHFLRDATGHDFAILATLTHARAVRAIAAVLRENLSLEHTLIGLKTKTLTGVVFATLVQHNALAEDACVLAKHQGNSDEDLDLAARFAVNGDLEPAMDDQVTRAAMMLAKAASPSPAKITADVVSACRNGGLHPAAIVEIITWLSVLQMLHRLYVYYMVGQNMPHQE